MGNTYVSVSAKQPVERGAMQGRHNDVVLFEVEGRLQEFGGVLPPHIVFVYRPDQIYLVLRRVDVLLDRFDHLRCVVLVGLLVLDFEAAAECAVCYVFNDLFGAGLGARGCWKGLER